MSSDMGPIKVVEVGYIETGARTRTYRAYVKLAFMDARQAVRIYLPSSTADILVMQHRAGSVIKAKLVLEVEHPEPPTPTVRALDGSWLWG